MDESPINHLAIVTAKAEHSPWMLATARHVLRQTPGVDAVTTTRALGRAMRDPCAAGVVLTPVGYPDDYVAWGLGIRGAVVFAFVREEFRRRGVGRHVISLVTTAPVGEQIPCAVWTEDFSEMAEAGFPITYSLREARQLGRMCR